MSRRAPPPLFHLSLDLSLRRAQRGFTWHNGAQYRLRLSLRKFSRQRQFPEMAVRAHNPKVVGSNPTPATTTRPRKESTSEAFEFPPSIGSM